MSNFKTNSELIGRNKEMVLERKHPRRIPSHFFGSISWKSLAAFFNNLALAEQDSTVLLCSPLPGRRAGQETLSQLPEDAKYLLACKPLPTASATLLHQPTLPLHRIQESYSGPSGGRVAGVDPLSHCTLGELPWQFLSTCSWPKVGAINRSRRQCNAGVILPPVPRLVPPSHHPSSEQWGTTKLQLTGRQCCLHLVLQYAYLPIGAHEHNTALVLA